MAVESNPDVIETGARISIDVTGRPAPQGSKITFHDARGRIRTKESSRHLARWRNDVVADTQLTLNRHNARLDPADWWNPLTGPVRVQVRFYTHRPVDHFGTGRNAGVLKPWAPRYVTTTPDIDKLLRATLDALKTARVYGDDSQVVKTVAEHLYANHRPGAFIHVDVIDDPGADPEAHR
jgi:Holliday junction resolvase RusA-like endonuclease